MRLATFYALNFTTNITVYFSCFLYLIFRKDILAIFTLEKLTFILLYVFSNFDITYFLELFFCDECSNIIHADRLTAVTIWAKNELLIWAISKISDMICDTKPAKSALAIY